MSCLAYLGSLATPNYMKVVQEGLDYIGFSSLVSASSQVFIKPNLTFPTYRRGVMTSPQAVEATVLALREYTPHIYVGDSDSGGYNRFAMDEVYEETGLRKFAKEHGVQIVNLSQVERKAISFRYRNRDFELELPRMLTDETDLLITMPVPKMHANTGVSLTFKNQWGCIPEPTDRLRLHPYFDHVILEVNKAVKAKIAIVDGRYGLNVNGPLRGEPVELNWVLVANDIGAAAVIACELMQVPLRQIKHLRYLKEMGFIPERNDIKVNCDIQASRKIKFFLRRKWTDYPGYLAFRHPLLAYLAYFSPLADLLHRVLYLFREPFYDYTKFTTSL